MMNKTENSEKFCLMIYLQVQAVLLLLGGCELTNGPNGLEVASQNQRVYLKA